jgi:HAD superfamily hydrolase (TIGR01484 family)
MAMVDQPLTTATPSASTSLRWLLVSDLDDTLTGDEAALGRFVAAVSQTPELAVAINSSRPLASIERTLAEFPANWRPAALIGAMGSQIEVRGKSLPDWPPTFDRWDRQPVDRALADLGLAAHRDELQTPHKVSYTVPPDRQPAARAAVEATGLDLKIVISGQDNFDVLPAGAGKAAAIRRLVTYFNLPLRDALIVAGDSANDLSMFDLAAQGIVVANAQDELREAVDADRVYFASQARAAGVLAGLAHWGVPVPTTS